MSFAAVLGMAMTVRRDRVGRAGADATFYTVTYVEVGADAARQAASLLKTYVTAGRKDDGNVSLEVLKGIDRPTSSPCSAPGRTRRRSRRMPRRRTART